MGMGFTGLLWRHAVRIFRGIEAAGFIPREDEYRVFPRTTPHQRIDQRGDILRAGLNVDGADRGIVVVPGGMFVPTHFRGRFNKNNLWQRSIFKICEVLADWRNVVRLYTEDMPVVSELVKVAL